MIDLLVNAPDRQSLIDLGFSLGILEDAGGTVPPLANEVNIHEIGLHSHEAGTPEEPSSITTPGWWVMLRAEDGYPVPEAILPLVVTPDPGNPAIPNRVWA